MRRAYFLVSRDQAAKQPRQKTACRTKGYPDKAVYTVPVNFFSVPVKNSTSILQVSKFARLGV
jgi:hypothetical protein